MHPSQSWLSSVAKATPTPSTPSPLTARRSTSTTRRTLAEMLFSAVYELATIKAIAPEGYRYTPEEWRVYSEGFYFALARSLKVMDLAENRFKLRRRTRHVETKLKNRSTREGGTAP